jgi:hypothetical protein
MQKKCRKTCGMCEESQVRKKAYRYLGQTAETLIEMKAAGDPVVAWSNKMNPAANGSGAGGCADDKDFAAHCAHMTDQCKSSAAMQKKCRKTCGMCEESQVLGEAKSRSGKVGDYMYGNIGEYADDAIAKLEAGFLKEAKAEKVKKKTNPTKKLARILAQQKKKATSKKKKKKTKAEKKEDKQKKRAEKKEKAADNKRDKRNHVYPYMKAGSAVHAEEGKRAQKHYNAQHADIDHKHATAKAWVHKRVFGKKSKLPVEPKKKPPQESNPAARKKAQKAAKRTAKKAERAAKKAAKKKAAEVKHHSLGDTKAAPAKKPAAKGKPAAGGKPSAKSGKPADDGSFKYKYKYKYNDKPGGGKGGSSPVKSGKPKCKVLPNKGTQCVTTHSWPGYSCKGTNCQKASCTCNATKMASCALYGGKIKCMTGSVVTSCGTSKKKAIVVNACKDGAEGLL